jgi:hypothetical protein
MIYHFCTISTHDHLYKAYALFDSIAAQGYDCRLHLLCTDARLIYPQPHEHIITYQLCDLEGDTARAIQEKYARQKDALRWSLKPVFMNYLLSEQGVEQLIYADNDICFYSDYTFLFGLLTQYSFLLTPHHYDRSPRERQNWLEANFRVGLYNAGFAGASKAGCATLAWWAESCLYCCEKNMWRGLFDDQKFLDLIPIVDPLAHVVQHKGCNVAEWNRTICKRSIIEGQVFINGQYPVVFIHFNSTTIREIMDQNDPLLIPLFEQYMMRINKYNSSISKQAMYVPYLQLDRIKLALWQWATDRGM